jgi:type I restriction enzyme S subunit
MPGDHHHGGVPVIKVRDIMDGQILDGNLLLTHPVIDQAYRRSRLETDDLLVTIRGSTGRVALVPSSLNGANITQDTARVRLKRRGSSEYLFHAFQASYLQSQIALRTIGQAVKGINISDVRTLSVAVPHTLPEQRTIAEALSDVDALLTGLDRLIAKKRDLKQAAMQQLLTAQTRLPGFHGEWKTKPLGELFSFSGGYSASRDQLSHEGHCYLHYGDIHTSAKTVVDVSNEHADIPKLDIPLQRIAPASLLEDGDVVFVDASEDDEGTSKHVVIVNKENRPFIAGLHTIVAKSKTDELVHEYRRFCFQTKMIKKQFKFYAVGTKVSGVSKSNITKIVLTFPPRAEQTAIAAVLSDMDAELAALEARREKTRDLKQAMMQDLLTGRVRLL